ncbi:MAG: hypothetical protein KJ947_21335 [Alphaproteobacteria bacterium]|nr:hypothetical protein [Alphaproteobacteria bacterium]MBU1552091.1 hypothetical protein [Alphaproteobacteria bacterium]MBU2337964.1 hypothetical protein [Alphaproteobacteria bacterium]MBU2386349.1 hypothetical protein [Alphaproteobacteria bacterium]
MRNQTRNLLVATALTMSLAGAAEAQGARAPRYADGVYTATGEYGGQPSHITVKATLENGIITAVTVTPHAYVPRSLELQRAFAAAVPKVVVGKRLDEVRVGKLAGSSSTPEGFNDAIRQIREKAARG